LLKIRGDNYILFNLTIEYIAILDNRFKSYSRGYYDVVYFKRLFNWKEGMCKMRIFKEDVKDIGVWISFIIFLLSLGYIGSGGESLIALLYVGIWIIFAGIGLFQSASEYLEEYYWNKREYKNREQSREQGTI